MDDETMGGAEAPESQAENPYAGAREEYAAARASARGEAPAAKPAAQPQHVPQGGEAEQAIDWRLEAARYQRELEALRQQQQRPAEQPAAKSAWQRPEFLAGPKDGMVKQFYDRLHANPELLSDPEQQQEYMGRMNLVQQHAFQQAVALLQQKEAFAARAYSEPHEWAAELMSEGTPAFEAVQRIAQQQMQALQQQFQEFQEQARQEKIAMARETWDAKFDQAAKSMHPIVYQMVAEGKFGGVDVGAPNLMGQMKAVLDKARAYAKEFGLVAAGEATATPPVNGTNGKPPAAVQRASQTAAPGNGRQAAANGNGFREEYAAARLARR